MSSNKTLTIGTLIILSFIGYFLIVRLIYPDMTTRSEFGEMFGGINALFSGLAFLGVIYTVLLQKEELRLQRKELELTRQELKRTAEAQEKSEQALSKQAASLKITAKLNGKSAVLQHFNSLIEITNSARYGIDHHKFNELKQKADKIIDEINSLVEGK